MPLHYNECLHPLWPCDLLDPEASKCSYCAENWARTNRPDHWSPRVPKTAERCIRCMQPYDKTSNAACPACETRQT